MAPRVEWFLHSQSVHNALSSVENCQQENSSLKSHFLQVHLFQTKNFEMHLHFLIYVWVRVHCRHTSQQIYKRSICILIGKRTGRDEYVEDQLNVASKTYLFNDTDGKRYLEDIYSMKSWSNKNAILNFFSPNQTFTLKFGHFCIIQRKNNRFQIKNEQEMDFHF